MVIIVVMDDVIIGEKVTQYLPAKNFWPIVATTLLLSVILCLVFCCLYLLLWLLLLAFLC
jgi:hypothetical protein